ncbi:D-alanyl-D-alanine carboxypeptidase family protein [Paenisporosarcina cavernae]|uniref:D-alanyl-D-alanine carboxypeptidase n=1 Tax=Paenisporosarcina cavernae TaxID=2320858 RepID=A0A385YV38_9BACL|nr:serine hydrolase [Paenisporosarcina cavernae]AYC29353.1 D-alanyl-D-alanine carboxypeptidase [Paenisporosarcina cavernae]
MKKFFLVLVIAILLSPIGTAHAASQSFVVMDGKSGRILQGLHEKELLPIASLTKIWTAFVVVNEIDLTKKVVISKESAMQEGSSIYLKAGSTYTIEELVYGLLLRSGNDAAHALALAVGGTEEGFVVLMNQYAREYGLLNTTFTNPSGLPNEAHLSTSEDTAKMLYFAMKHPSLRKIISTKRYANGNMVFLNKHRLLHENNYAVSGKTGFTKAAGRTLATFFEKDNESVIVVTLNYSNDWNVHRMLAKETFENYHNEIVIPKGEFFTGDLPLFEIKKDVTLLVSNNDRFSNRIVWNQSKNTGTWIVSDKRNWHFLYPLRTN